MYLLGKYSVWFIKYYNNQNTLQKNVNFRVTLAR